MQPFLDLFILINCSTHFRRLLRPSSGVQNCTYNVRYCQTNTAACCYRGWHRTYEVHLIHDSSRQQYWLTIPDDVCTVLCSWWRAEEPPETCREIYRNKYRVSITSFHDHKNLLQENYVENKHTFFQNVTQVKKFFYKISLHLVKNMFLYST
jgi:hypothetical protein